MVIVTVMYPKSGESKFDIDYYLDKHTPLVKARLSAIGLESINLMRGTGALGGGPPAYEVIAQLHFSSAGHLSDALARHGEEIIGDIANFTNVQPVMQLNEAI